MPVSLSCLSPCLHLEVPVHLSRFYGRETGSLPGLPAAAAAAASSEQLFVRVAAVVVVVVDSISVENSLASSFLLPPQFPVYSPQNVPRRVKRLGSALSVSRTNLCHPQVRLPPAQPPSARQCVFENAPVDFAQVSVYLV